MPHRCSFSRFDNGSSRGTLKRRGGRYATLSLNYFGDSILNSMGDMLSCSAGFALASRVGVRRSLALFLIMEVLLLIFIRDNLTLNVVMLIHPVQAIKAW